MRRLILWGTVISGVVAAYLMYKRGEDLGTIAQKTTANPVGTLATELKNAS